MAIDLFGMIDDFKNSDTFKGASQTLKNATGITYGNNKPFPTCPKGCYIFPEACDECSKYKKQLSEYLHLVENLEEYYGRFSIDPTASKEGEGTCYFCGAPVGLKNTKCEYCDSILNSTNTVIRIQSKDCIPNPILQAEQIIYERYRMAEIYQKKKGSGGLVKGLLGMGMIAGNKMNDFSTLMTTEEIQKMATTYGVSVKAYLEGLDCGKYLTLAGKTNSDALNAIATAANAGAASSNTYRSGTTATSSPTTTQPQSKSYTMLDYMQQRAQNHNPGYLGAAPGTCCGRCRYYEAYEKKCLYNSFRHPSGPSDSCGDFTSL